MGASHTTHVLPSIKPQPPNMVACAHYPIFMILYRIIIYPIIPMIFS